MSEVESDYGSDFSEGDMHDLGKGRIQLQHSHRQPQCGMTPNEESDYGSDLDEETVERIHALASCVPSDLQSLGACATQTSSPLLALPPEIRNLFYESIFEDFTAHIVPCQWYRPPSMLLVCKQIHGEAIAVFYNAATFQTQNISVLERRLLRLRQSHRRLIRRIRIDSAANHGYRPLPARVPLWGDRMMTTSMRSALKAEADMQHFHECMRKHRDMQFSRIEASIEMQDGRILWTDDVTLVLLNIVEVELAKLKADETRAVTTSREVAVSEDEESSEGRPSEDEESSDSEDHMFDYLSDDYDYDNANEEYY
jgi:hypothetical protein